MKSILINNKQVDSHHGVLLLSPSSSLNFESLYLAVRSQEQRLADDNQLKRLPLTDEEHVHATEWKIRDLSCRAVVKHLKELSLSPTDWVLDIGCGNGWQSHQLAQHTKANVLAIDINMHELEQGARVFRRDNLVFAYLDLFSNFLSTQRFKFILASSCFQYFPEGKGLINQCLKLLTKDGEFHIIDSPFYTSAEVENAKGRSEQYYHQLGFSQMGSFYHHHELSMFEVFNTEFLYKKRMTAGVSGCLQNPFPWIKICR